MSMSYSDFYSEKPCKTCFNSFRCIIDLKGDCCPFYVDEADCQTDDEEADEEAAASA